MNVVCTTRSNPLRNKTTMHTVTPPPLLFVFCSLVAGTEVGTTAVSSGPSGTVPLS